MELSEIVSKIQTMRSQSFASAKKLSFLCYTMKNIDGEVTRIDDDFRIGFVEIIEEIASDLYDMWWQLVTATEILNSQKVQSDLRNQLPKSQSFAKTKLKKQGKPS